MENYTACFFGHRKINKTEELKNSLYCIIKNLIVNEKVNTFLFGSKSEFDDLCHETVTALKKEYPHIKRIYVRAEYQYIDNEYKNYLLRNYEDTYYPENLTGAGRASYVKRNQEMINKSKFCITYYDKNYLPPRRKIRNREVTDHQPKSGTAIAYSYARKKKKEIINVVHCNT